MNIKKIKNLYKKYLVPVHIRRHMAKVAAVAYYIGGKIEKNSRRTKINLKLLKYASMLHDLVKICEVDLSEAGYCEKGIPKKTWRTWHLLIKKYKDMGHIDAAFQILVHEGENLVAEIIKKHKYDAVIAADPREKLNTIEEKILYYADKRVLHDNIVPVCERLKDGRIRYLNTKRISAREKLIEKAVLNLEKELCALAKIDPNEINEENPGLSALFHKFLRL